jgi:predicted nucleic acid-binding protein
VLIIDASVAVKWLLPEAGSGQAEALLESGGEFAAPTLIRIEVAAAIARKVRLDELEPRDGEAAFALWLQCIKDGVIALISEQEHVPAAWKLAVDLQHPMQDCLYLAVAQKLSAKLVTANRKFAAKAWQYSQLQLLDHFALQPPTRTARETEVELIQIRKGRHQPSGGRRSEST